MRNAAQYILFAVCGIAFSSCDLKNPLVNEPTVVRIVAISYAELPAGMADDSAMVAMKYNTGFFASATEHAFFTSDSAFGRRMNRVIVTPAGSSHSGSTQLFAGQDVLVHPPTTNGPLSMTLSIPGLDQAAEIGTYGTYEIFLNGIGAVGSGSVGGPLEFTLESYNSSTTDATGSFMFVGRVLSSSSDTRRWAVKGSFSLRSN